MSNTILKGSRHADARTAASDFSPAATKDRIAIVSDDDSTRLTLRRLLRAAGADAKSYHSTRDFLVSGHFELTSCLLLDTTVPARDCLELSERQRDMKPLPTIILGNQSPPVQSEPPLRGAAIIYLSRPTEWETLRQAVAAALQR